MKSINKVITEAKDYKTELFLIIYLFIYISALSIWGIQQPAWGDEEHFFETVKLFGSNFTLDTLRTYKEMSTPLPFILYALWGKLFSYELPMLRVFSLIVAAITYIILYVTSLEIVKCRWHALLFVIFFSLIPYNIGASLFIFTEMLTFLFVILFIYGAMKRVYWLIAVAGAGMLLSRQYTVYMILALIVHELIYTIKNKKFDFYKFVSLGVACMPLAGLIILWNGLCPDSNLRSIYLTDGLSYHPVGATLYIAQVAIYLFPFILVRAKEIFRSSLTFSAIPFGVLWYWFFPVGVSPVVLAGKQYTTNGYFHRTLNVLFPLEIVNIIFAVSFLIGFIVLLNLIVRYLITFKEMIGDLNQFLILSVFFFFLTQPFSYLWWEKYFLPIMPSLMFVLYQLNNNSKKICGELHGAL